MMSLLLFFGRNINCKSWPIFPVILSDGKDLGTILIELQISVGV